MSQFLLHDTLLYVLSQDTTNILIGILGAILVISLSTIIFTNSSKEVVLGFS